MVRFIFEIAFVFLLFAWSYLTFGPARLKHWARLITGQGEAEEPKPLQGKNILLLAPANNDFMALVGQQINDIFTQQGATVTIRERDQGAPLIAPTSEKGFDNVIAFTVTFPEQAIAGNDAVLKFTGSTNGEVPFQSAHLDEPCQFLARQLSA